jgi:hypothetical protein
VDGAVVSFSAHLSGIAAQYAQNVTFEYIETRRFQLRFSTALVTFVLTLLTAIPGASALGGSFPDDPLKLWGDTYLLNEIMVREMNLVGQLRLTEPRVSTPAEKYDEQFLVSRAEFAMEEARKSGQVLTQSIDFKVQKRIAGTKAKAVIDRDSISQLPLPTHLASWFRLWPQFAREYGVVRPDCQVSETLIQDYARFQQGLIASAKNPSPSDFQWLFSRSTVPEIRCLAVRLMSTQIQQSDKSNANLEPVYLLASLVRVSEQKFGWATVTAFKALYATRLVQLNMYGEALAVLLELQDKTPAYRLPYDIVQRLYSHTQKGKGVVAFKNL